VAKNFCELLKHILKEVYIQIVDRTAGW